MDSSDSSKQQNAYSKPAIPSQLSDLQDHQQQQMHITDFQDITFDSAAENRTGNTLEQLYENQQPQNSSTGGLEDVSCERTSSSELKKDNNAPSPITENCHKNTSNDEPSATDTEIQQATLDRLDSQRDETSTDDDEFVALCTDASLVLNNDQSHNYYTNELYQPMKNGNQPIEDEYLLYQELQFIESQEPNRGERGLTKILEGDEGDVDEDELESGHHQDAFDRLQLTNIIDSFKYPSPWSPLIDSCRSPSRDPLISGACDAQDKPDSTSNRTISPSNSSDSGGHCQAIQEPNNHFISSADHRHDHPHSQFDCNSHDVRESHFSSELSRSDQANDINRESQQHVLHREFAYNDQMCDQDNSSENNCLKPLGSAFLSGPTHEPNDLLGKDSANLNCFENQNFPNSTNTAKIATHNISEPEVSGRKRSLQEIVESDDGTSASSEGRKTCLKSTKNRGKRKKVSSNEQQANQLRENLASSEYPISDMKSSMLSNGQQLENRSAIIISNIINKTNEIQQKHIANEEDDYDNMIMDDDMSIADDTASSSVGHRQPHLSKYRRRTANARERIRMREINQAFEKLKKVVPVELIQQSISDDESDQTSVSSRRNGNKSGSQRSDSQSVKLTKIATLRLAKSYIAILSDVLSQHAEGSASTIINRSDSSENSQTNRLGGSQASRPGEKAPTSARKRRSRASTKTSSASANKSKIITSNNKGTDSRAPTNNEACMQSLSSPEAEKSVVVMSQEAQICQQQVQHQPIMIASNHILQQQSMNGSCTTIQPHQLKQQHFAYHHQQPLNIAQTGTVNGQERTFITPVAVAILGIPNQGTVDQSQTLQLLGIQGAQQLQQLQHRHQQQQLQSNQVCNIVTQQPQQVTLTLDEINGLSVLRLNNPQQTIGQGQQTIQLQSARTLVQQQPTQVLTSTTNRPGTYAAYQPIHISQFQTSNSLAAVRQINGQTTATLHLGQRNNCSLNPDTSNTSNEMRSTSTHQTQITSENNHHQFIASAINSPTKTNTGTNSDFRNFGISPNMIAQHLSNNSNNVKTIAHQIKFQQQSNCAGQIQLANSKLVAVAPTSQLFQASAPPNGHGRANSTANPANLIYITPPTSLSSNINNEPALVQTNNFADQHQNQQFTVQAQQQTFVKNAPQQESSQETLENGTRSSSTISNVHQFEQMKFVTQFNAQTYSPQHRQQQSQDKIMHNSEANIRQLVATLTTSIHPSSGEQTKSCNLDENNGEQQQVKQQQQQHKRTYRFHNYDGNMITNHLYHNNHDKQQQTQASKRCQQQVGQQQIAADQANGTHQIHPSQRSRQNSLSSTCSTTSSASSSLASLTSSSPTVPMIPIMIKSPSLESNSLSTPVAASD